jgi:hypothetical protein
VSGVRARKHDGRAFFLDVHHWVTVKATRTVLLAGAAQARSTHSTQPFPDVYLDQ